VTSPQNLESNSPRSRWTITRVDRGTPSTDVAIPPSTELTSSVNNDLSPQEHAELARLMATARSIAPWSGPGDDGPGAPPPAASPTLAARPRRRGLIAAIVAALVVLVVGGIAWATVGGRPDPADTVTAVTDDLREWDSISYRGRLDQFSSGDIEIDLTVNRAGDIAGTLARPEGGRAEYAQIDGVEMLKADAAWFADEIDPEDRAGRLADRWVKNPNGLLLSVATQVKSPEALASDLRGPLPDVSLDGWSPFKEGDPEIVDGAPARRITGIGPEMLVSDGGDPRLLGVRPTLAPTGATMMQVAPGTPGAVAAIEAARTARDSAVDYSQRLFAKPVVTVEWTAPPPATCPRVCSVSVRVTNTEAFAASGSVTAEANGRYGGFGSFDLGPGASTTLTLDAFLLEEGPVQWTTEVLSY
jgi:hypothetical protein